MKMVMGMMMVMIQNPNILLGIMLCFIHKLLPFVPYHSQCTKKTTPDCALHVATRQYKDHVGGTISLKKQKGKSAQNQETSRRETGKDCNKRREWNWHWSYISEDHLNAFLLVR